MVEMNDTLVGEFNRFREHQEKVIEAQKAKLENGILSRFDERKLLKEIKQALDENNDLLSETRELSSEVDYAKQRENKLMYFLFVLKQKGVAISHVFAAHIQKLPTSRFSHENEENFQTLYYEQ